MPGEYRNTSCAADDVTWGQVQADEMYVRAQGGRLVVDKDVHIVQVIKRQVAGRARKLIAVERRLVHVCVQVAEQIMLATQTQLGVINTAYIERLQATLRG